MDEIEREYTEALEAYRKAAERLATAKAPYARRQAAEARAKAEAKDAAYWADRRADMKRDAEQEAYKNAICQKASEGMDAAALAKHFDLSLRKVREFIARGPSTYYAERLAEEEAKEVQSVNGEQTWSPIRPAIPAVR